MDEAIINKKYALLALLVIFFIFILQYLLTHSILIVESASGPQRTINLRHGNDAQDFSLKDGSKIFLLKRGEYSIEVSEGDNLKTYYRSLGAFWINKVTVDTSPQKQALSLGSSNLKCVLNNYSTNSVIYYPCDPSTSNTILATNDGFTTRPAFPNEDIKPEDEEIYYETSLGNNISLRPLGEGFVRAVSDGDKIKIRQINSNPSEISAGFTGNISDDFFSVTDGGNHTVMTAFDDSRESLLIFKGLSGQPSRINLSDELTDDEGLDIKILTSENYTYVLATNSLESIEGDPHQEEQVTPHSDNQRILVVDNHTNKISARHNLPKDLFIRMVSVNTEGNLIYVPLYDEKGDIYMVAGTKGPKKIETFLETVGSFCWKNTDSFYYTLGSNTSIYLYSLKDRTSSLVYSNPKLTIYNMHCSDSAGLYFDITYPNEPDPSIVNHFMLTDQVIKGTRPETITPLYTALGYDIAEATLFRRTVNVSLLNGSPLKEAVRQDLLNQLKSKGVRTDDLDFNFNY